MRESGNKEPLVSVIVPIYNVVDFINRGIEFLFKQDFTDFEVLLIDDGSTDGSGRICDFWAEKKENIRVFHKENEGAGSARNVGILNAYG
ncbi:glycosyltransferase, partial [Phocaeicola sp.]